MGTGSAAPAGAGANAGPGGGGLVGWAAGVISRATQRLISHASQLWAPRSPLGTKTAFLRRRHRWRQVRTRWRLRQLREQARADRLERFIERMVVQMHQETARQLKDLEVH